MAEPEWRNGIRARLKIASRKGWEFESPLRHKVDIVDFFAILIENRSSTFSKGTNNETASRDGFAGPASSLAASTLRSRLSPQAGWLHALQGT